MILTLRGEPCRNFCILNKILIPKDPYDGCEKLVLSNYAAEAAGSLIIIDTETLQSEQYELPNDSGAWALLWLEERGELLVGTCDHFGSLHCFVMAERRFREPLRLQDETYLWDFTQGGDGLVYASTYPGCSLVQYNPETRKMVSLGHVGPESKNQYSRQVLTTSTGDIAVSAGYYHNEAWLYRVKTGEWVSLGEEGDRVQAVGNGFIAVGHNGQYKFYDPETLEQLGDVYPESAGPELLASCSEPVREYLTKTLHPEPIPGLPAGQRGVKTASGCEIGVIGQELFLWKDGQLRFVRIPAEAPVTAIMTIAAMDGAIWGSCEFGQTIFRFDPKTGTSENSCGVTDAGGEVYGIVPLDGKLYLASYAGGDHIVYDPAQPWDQHGNINPKSLRSVAPQMVRPHAKSVVGPDGAVWTGWYASYGTFGGGLSRIDPATEEVTSWFGLIPGQAMEHLAADDSSLYAVTSGSASGMADRDDQFHLLKIAPDGSITKRHPFEPGVSPRRLAVFGHRICVILCDKNAMESRVALFDKESLALQGSFLIGALKEDSEQNFPTDLMFLDHDRLLVFTASEIAVFSLPDGRHLDSLPSPGYAQTCTRDENGLIWFASKRRLFTLEL